MKKEKNISKEIVILKEQLTSLLKNNNSTDGIVISLQGNWGIGKTVFWNKYAQQTWNENQHVYISLFGKHTLDDIKKQIVLKVYDGNKIANFIEENPLIGKIMETKFGFDTSLIASTFSKDTFKNIVICFDDFERISPNLSVSEVLGYISELKEQNQCKIVIINNNDSLKEQDELNHKKILKKKEIKKSESEKLNEEVRYGNILNEFETIEKFFICQTNNQEIFNKFSEKIIDVTLYYEPHYSNNLDLIKDESLDFVNWEMVEELLSKVVDTNKQCNIRLMKQLASKFKLFEKSFNNSINKKISNSLVLEVFKKVFNEPRLDIDKFEFTNIESLSKYLNNILKKHYLDVENFNLSLENLNDEINKYDNTDDIYDKTRELYYKFLYDLAYKDKDFAKEFYILFNDNKSNIVKTINVNNFQWYIELLIKIDNEGKERYQILYLEAMKLYIDYIIEKNGDKPSFIAKKEMSILEQNEELKLYFNEQKNILVTDKASNVESIMKAMQEPKKKNGYGPDDEILLASISKSQHIIWMKENAEYLEISFDFVRWVQGFSGTKPFERTYFNIIEAISDLSQVPEYKNKLELMTRYFKK